jgi:hypothetical protein
MAGSGTIFVDSDNDKAIPIVVRLIAMYSGAQLRVRSFHVAVKDVNVLTKFPTVMVIIP